jgi:serine/threonine protein kinase
VALKVMNQKIAATANSRRRFLHEARAMAAVRHDNVATIFEVGESAGTPFMAMEMLKGGTLETFNRDKQRLGYEKIIEYAQQISRGLAAAHEKGIVHRDIKPANIWIEEGIDRIKILDFGLALASTPVDHLSGRGAVIGTPGYLSPEQARSEPLDDRSDLYSLGVVLYELATGQLPLQSSSVSGQLIAILAHRPTPVHEINPEIPKPLCDLIHRLLRKEPRARPQSATALLSELEQVRKECDAKSEVAQAISKLQVGLNQVVGKTDSGSMLDVLDEMSATIPDPLSSIPTTPAASSGSNHSGAAHSGRFQVPSTGKLAKKKTAQPLNWKLYGPLLAALSLLIVVLPLMAFFFSQVGRRSEAIVTELSNEPGKLPESLTKHRDKTLREYEQQRRAAELAQQNQQAAERAQQELRDIELAEQAQPAIPTTNESPVAPSIAPVVASKMDVDADPNQTDPPLNPDAAEMPVKVSTSGDSTVPGSAVDSTPESPSPTSQPPVPQWVTVAIKTNFGRGADVTAKKGYSQSLEDSETVEVQTRWQNRLKSSVEVEHAYLRFDLAQLADTRAKLSEVALVLTRLPGDQPQAGFVRVHGWVNPKTPVWPEQELIWSMSLSDDLSPYPVLAEQKFTKRDRTVRLASPQLTEFIATAKEDVVTLILVGADSNDATKQKTEVRFYSSEGSFEHAPRLEVVMPAPAQPPPSSDVVDDDGLLAVREAIGKLRGMDGGKLEALLKLVESGRIDEAVKEVKELTEKLRSQRLPEPIKDTIRSALKSIQQAAEKQLAAAANPPSES